MQEFRSSHGVFSRIGFTALLSALVLCAAIGYRTYNVYHPHVASEPTAANVESAFPGDWQSEFGEIGLAAEQNESSLDELSLIGPVVASELLVAYEDLIAGGSYTKEDLRKAAEEIAAYVKVGVSFDEYDTSAFVSIEDTSKDRVIQYAADVMRVLEPLNEIPEAEYVTYAKFTESGNATYLAQLMARADLYRTTAKAAADVHVPNDALVHHRNLVHSLLAFAEVLEGLATHGEDPIASVALLRTYNETESGILTAYREMRAYYDRKML